jgi:ABC-2 type transport system permease protein
MTIPGVLGMLVAFSGLTTPAHVLMSEREDGTLLRMKATLNGMQGYLAGKTVTVIGMSLPSLAVLLVPSAFLFDGLRLSSFGTWFTLAWVLALGLAATMPVGVVLGSLFWSPSSLGLLSVLMPGLVAISGVFYPITTLPVWLHWLAQIFPIYWLGLGTRSALLPGPMAAVEIGEAWRHLETLGVLGIWAVVGLVSAPIVLRRVARRESGSAVETRRGKNVQQRVG